MGVEEVVRGNALAGSFALSLGGAATSALPFDATAAAVEAELEARARWAR